MNSFILWVLYEKMNMFVSCRICSTSGNKINDIFWKFSWLPSKIEWISISEVQMREPFQFSLSIPLPPSKDSAQIKHDHVPKIYWLGGSICGWRFKYLQGDRFAKQCLTRCGKCGHSMSVYGKHWTSHPLVGIRQTSLGICRTPYVWPGFKVLFRWSEVGKHPKTHPHLSGISENLLAICHMPNVWLHFMIRNLVYFLYD